MRPPIVLPDCEEKRFRFQNPTSGETNLYFFHKRLQIDMKVLIAKGGGFRPCETLATPALLP